jgi:hypothetical protein
MFPTLRNVLLGVPTIGDAAPHRAAVATAAQPLWP